MEEIKRIVYAACFLSIGISIVNILKPGNKFDKQIRWIFSLVFLASIMTIVLSAGIEIVD